MLIRCVNRSFRDLKAPGKPERKIGEEWESTPERLAEINSTGYGVMAEAVEQREEPVQEPEAKPKRASRRKAAGE